MIYSEVPIVGITGTYYPDLLDPRFEVSLATAESWRDNNLPLVISNFDPNGDGRTERAYRERGAIVVDATVGGIASQRQQAAEVALTCGAEKLLSHEPEKTSTPGFARDVAKLLEDSSIIVVGRTDRSLETLPPFQRRTELLASYILEHTLAIPFDSLAGPRGYTSQGALHLLNYPSHETGMNNWIYLYENVLAARANGEAVSGTRTDILYPQILVVQETDNPDFDRKRLDQFWLQLNYLLNRPEDDNDMPGLDRFVKDQLDAVPADATTTQLFDAFEKIEGTLIQDYGYTLG
jgi:hypothetical protein